MSNQRKIIHIDMDAFYAAVEQLDQAEYRGKPIVVGGSPQSRGVVCTASYEARVFGIHSAMPSAQAWKRCPQAVFLPPRMERYREISSEVFSIFSRYSDLVEPLSLDEAYLDVTCNHLNEPSATRLAKKILEQIQQQTGLTASAGVAPNKFLAKIASDMNKPNGLTVIPPEKVTQILEDLPVGKIPGIGKVTEKKMESLGIRTSKDLRGKTEEELSSAFGKHGSWYYRVARGEDDRPVVASRVRKSIGCEDTFARDIVDLPQLRNELSLIVRKTAQRLEKKGFWGRTVTLKVTYGDFRKITRSRTLPQAVSSIEILEQTAHSLLELTEAGTRAIRLIGVAVSNEMASSPQTEKIETFPRQLCFRFTTA